MVDDIWTDITMRGFMAIFASWIQKVVTETPAGTQTEYVHRVDLIGFICVPGHHSGVNLAQVFHFALTQLGITPNKVKLFTVNVLKYFINNCQVGWITSDNARNNDTLMESLAELMGYPLSWDPEERRIRCSFNLCHIAIIITDFDQVFCTYC